MTKALFYEGHNEYTAYGLFKNVNADRAEKHLKHLALRTGISVKMFDQYKLYFLPNKQTQQVLTIIYQ